MEGRSLSELLGPRTPTGRASACRAAPSSRPPAPAAAPRTRPGRSSAWSADRSRAARVPDRAARRPRPRRRRRRSGARRRVLFADLSGYTAVAERMDPEAVKALVDRTLRRLGERDRALRRLDRQVHRRQRDGGLRRAGRPRGRPRAGGPGRPRDAGGDGGDRTGRAARRTASSFSLRVGINSGEVLAGRDGRPLHGDGRRRQRRRAPAGRGAARTASPSASRPTGATREAIAYERLEPLSLKGKEEPVPAWEATGALAEPRRAAVRRASTPLVGREEEAGLLRLAGRPRPARGPPPPGHRHRPGRRRQVEAAPRADDQRSPSRDEPPTIRRGQLPALRVRHRLLGAGGGPQRRVRDPRHRRRLSGLGEARRGVERADRASAATSEPASGTPR